MPTQVTLTVDLHYLLRLYIQQTAIPLTPTHASLNTSNLLWVSSGHKIEGLDVPFSSPGYLELAIPMPIVGLPKQFQGERGQGQFPPLILPLIWCQVQASRIPWG